MTFRTYWTSSILNHEIVTGSKFFAEYIYNAFALNSTEFDFALDYLYIYAGIVAN